MKFKKISILFLSIILLSSCEEQFDWNRENRQSDLIVIEAVLTNEKKNHLIRISKPYFEQNTTPEPVSGALVGVRTNAGIFLAVENPIGSGLYYTDSLTAVFGKAYTLIVEYDGESYFASAAQPPVEPLPPLSAREVSDGLYTLNFNNSGANPNYIKHFVDWQSVGNCSQSLECQAKVIQYDLKNVDINAQFKPEQEQINFPVGTKIIRRKFSVSERYKEYLRGMLSETSWRGGIFDVYPANAATNLSEGAVGFFAISTVVSDTTVINQ